MPLLIDAAFSMPLPCRYAMFFLSDISSLLYADLMLYFADY